MKDGAGSVENPYPIPFSYLDTDGTLAANSDAKVPSQKAVKTYTDAVSSSLSAATPEIVVGETGYTTLAAAVTTIGATEATLVLPPGSHVGGGVTVPATLSLKVLKGATITVANGATFTCNGPFEAGLYQVFSLTGTGAVAGLNEAKPQWFGSNAAALTAALSAANVVILPDGTTFEAANVTVPANKYIYGPNATLKMPNASALGACILNCSGNSNININIGTVDGNKANQSGGSADADGMQLIKGDGGSNISIKIGTAKDNYFPAAFGGGGAASYGAIDFRNGNNIHVFIDNLLAWEREGVFINSDKSSVCVKYGHGTADPAGENTLDSWSMIAIRNYSVGQCRIYDSYGNYSGASTYSINAPDCEVINCTAKSNYHYACFVFGHVGTSGADGTVGTNLVAIDAGFNSDGRGFHISANTSRPIYLNNITSVTASAYNLYIDNTSSVGTVINGGYFSGAASEGIKLYTVSGQVILNGLTVTGAGSYGIFNYIGVSYLEINNCNISSNTNHGIYVANGSGYSDVLKVSNSKINSNGGSGVYEASFTKMSFLNSDICSNTAAGIRTYARPTFINNCRINFNGTYGILNDDGLNFCYVANTEINGNGTDVANYNDLLATKLPNNRKLVYTSATPTRGSFKQGDMAENTGAASGQPSGWRCTATGTFPNVTLNGVGTTTNNSATVAMTSTTGLRIGYYVDFSAGFATLTGHEIVDMVDNVSITVDAKANASGGGVNVVTADPTFAAMANLP